MYMKTIDDTQVSVTEKNKQVMEQFIRFINTGDRTIGEAIISPDVIFYAPRLPNLYTDSTAISLSLT